MHWLHHVLRVALGWRADHGPPRARAWKARPLSTAGLAIAMTAATGTAQTDPSLLWQSIRTRHFQIVFSPGLEPTARRAAGSAERAYVALSRELHPPRGPITIVVADNLDISNGYATTFPTNRIVIYARPTIAAGALKFVDDWVDLVVVHELTHLFQLDRARGIWSLGQKIFGRNPLLFPHAYAPSWLVEGIAVHYESKLTGAGRDAGTDFDAIARAHDLGATLPARNQLSGGSPRFPLGSIAYTYGTPLVGEAVSKGKPNGMREYVDAAAAGIIPFMLNTTAKRGFGISFDSAFRLWRDSVHHSTQQLAARVAAQRPVVSGGWYSSYARWADTNTIEWAGTDPKSLPALKQVRANGGPVRVLSVRNSTDAHAPLPDGRRLFAQFEYVDPYTVRSDLYLEGYGTQRRLTYGERLTQPDARICAGAPPTRDICVVAVQLLPGTARLVHVRVYHDGGAVEITPITSASADELYSDPRWSRSGDRIAVTHRTNGAGATGRGWSGIDILDASGRLVLRTIGRARAVTGWPAWGAGDSTLYFTSDRTGRSALYRANVNTGAIVRVADSPTALFESEPSPDGLRLATFQLGAKGYDLTLVDANATGVAADSASVLPPARTTPFAPSDAPVGNYSPWRSLIPRYWLPAIEPADDGGYAYGFNTSGSDLVGRHDWNVRGTFEPTHREPSLLADYSYAGLGVPIVRFGGEQFWDHFGIADSTRQRIGTLRRRRAIADAGLTFVRRRYNAAASLSVGGAYEWRNDLTDPVPLLQQLDSGFRRQRTYPSYFLSVGFGNARQPWLALGPENGISVGATLRQRWRGRLFGAESATRATTLSGSVVAYRALDLGGPTHHLVALRAAAATTDITAPTDFAAGGGSSGFLQVAPGLTFGDGRRTFFVRGARPGVQAGSRAVAMNAEYRFPIALPARGFWTTPLFLQRISGAVFTDAASAWCPAASATSPICPRVTAHEWIASAGAELHVDMALQYDAPYRFRLGVAMPTMGRAYFGSSGSVYLTVGLPF